MDLSNLHALSNSYSDVRLVSLRDWHRASEFSPRDKGGPYVVVQQAYDPLDVSASADEFVLGKSGEWITLANFFKLPGEMRREEFVYGTAAEVIGLLESLPGKVKIIRGTEAAKLLVAEEASQAQDDLSAAFAKATAKSP